MTSLVKMPAWSPNARPVRERDGLVERVVRRRRCRRGRRPPRTRPSRREARRRSPSGGGARPRASLRSARRAPALRASSIHSRTRSRSRGEISGPDVGLLVGRIADLQRLDAREEALEERVVRRALDVDPLHRDAALAGEARTRSLRAGVPRRRGRRPRATITGVALPSSRFTRLRAARSRSFQPTGADPVKVMSFTRSSVDEDVSDLAGRRRRRR